MTKELSVSPAPRTISDGGAFSPFWRFPTAGAPSAVESLQAGIPTEYSLGQNYPNPFNPSTRFRFSIPKSQRVTLTVFDLLGRELQTLVAEELSPGTYQATWNASVPSGIYLHRIREGISSKREN